MRRFASDAPAASSAAWAASPLAELPLSCREMLQAVGVEAHEASLDFSATLAVIRYELHTRRHAAAPGPAPNLDLDVELVESLQTRQRRAASAVDELREETRAIAHSAPLPRTSSSSANSAQSSPSNSRIERTPRGSMIAPASPSPAPADAARRSSTSSGAPPPPTHHRIVSSDYSTRPPVSPALPLAPRRRVASPFPLLRLISPSPHPLLAVSLGHCLTRRRGQLRLAAPVAVAVAAGA